MQVRKIPNHLYPEEHRDECSYCVGLGCRLCLGTGLLMSRDYRFNDRMAELRARQTQGETTQ